MHEPDGYSIFFGRISFNLHPEIVGCEASKTILHGALTKFPFCTALQELQFFLHCFVAKVVFFGFKFIAQSK